MPAKSSECRFASPCKGVIPSPAPQGKQGDGTMAPLERWRAASKFVPHLVAGKYQFGIHSIQWNCRPTLTELYILHVSLETVLVCGTTTAALLANPQINYLAAKTHTQSRTVSSIWRVAYLVSLAAGRSVNRLSPLYCQRNPAMSHLGAATNAVRLHCKRWPSANEISILSPCMSLVAALGRVYSEK